MTDRPIRVAAPDFIGPWLVITIDGQPGKMVIEADEESGTGTRYVTDTSGRLIVEGEFAKTEPFKGKVKVSLMDGAPEPVVIEYQRRREPVKSKPPHPPPSLGNTPPAAGSGRGAR